MERLVYRATRDGPINGQRCKAGDVVRHAERIPHLATLVEAGYLVLSQPDPEPKAAPAPTPKPPERDRS